MAIHHISYSSSGGAGRVAGLLSSEQSKSGYDSFFHSVSDTNLWANPWADPRLTAKAVIDQYVIANSSESTLFSLLRSGHSSELSLPLNNSDIVHLHWTAGILEYSDIPFISQSVRKLVWTLHDMEPFTGGCHHSHQCTNFETNCRACPQVRNAFRNLVTRKFDAKIASISDISNLKIVAPSDWMKSQAQRSAILSGHDIETVPNPINPVYFETPESSTSRRQIGLNQDVLVAILIAEQLGNPSKRIEETLNNFLLDENGNPEDNRFAIVVGSTQNFRTSLPNVLMTGSVSPPELAAIARIADVHITMSEAESAGMTVAEMAALGVPSIVRKSTALSDMIQEGKTGIALDEIFNLRPLLNSLTTNTGFLRHLGKNAAALAESKFSLNNVSSKYLEIYNS